MTPKEFIWAAVIFGSMLVLFTAGLSEGADLVKDGCIHKNEIVTKQGTYLCIKKYELKEEIK